MTEKFEKKHHCFLCLISFLTMMIGAMQTTGQTIASFSVNSSSGCKPLNVLFTNASTNATSYSWDFGNGVTSVAVNPSNIYTNAGIYTVTLTATGPAGSHSTVLNIEVVNPPVVSFAASVQAVCQGNETVQFTNNSAGFDSCVWDFGDGTTSNLFNPSHIYSMPGNFNVTLIIFDNQHQCSAALTQHNFVTVHPSPVISFTVNDTVSCDQNHLFQFNSSTSNATSWLWNFGDNVTSTLQHPSHTYADSGYFNVSLIATSANGCSDSLLQNNFVHIKFNPVPAISPSYAQGCVPLANVYYTPTTNLSSCIWDFGDGTIDTALTGHHTYTTAGSFTIAANVLYKNGCANQNSYSPVQVDSNPVLSYYISNNVGCAPLNVQFINNNAGANYTWLWDFGDGNTSTQAIPTHVYTNDGIYTVSLTATTTLGCTFGYPLSAKVSVSSPTALYTPDRTSGCSPLTINFNNISQNAVQYVWHFGDGDSSAVANPTHSYQQAGTYYPMLVVINSNNCTDTFIYSQPIVVSSASSSFNPLPPITACAPFTMNFSDNSVSTSWLWNFGDGATSTLQSPSHVYTTPGTFVVTLNTQGANGFCSQAIPNVRTIVIHGGEANFSHTEQLCPPYVGYFQDSSTNAIAWLWNFGDGATSTLQNPAHTFASPGFHSVALTITTPDSCTFTVVKNFTIYFEPLTANTSTVVTDTLLPMTVQFHSGTTGATYWLWDFGDGSTSVLPDPVHIYTVPGPYTITLTIGNDSCSRIYNYPPVTFGMGITNPGGGSGGNPIIPPVEYNCAPYEVQFSNPFLNAISWLWDFGDGNTSTSANPIHIYNSSGDFEVKLNVLLSNGSSDSLIIPEIIFVRNFNTQFTTSSVNSCSGVTVTFAPADTTISCQWNFGDGANSTATIAQHTYANTNSNYFVTLLATDTNGCSVSTTHTFYVSETNPFSVSTTRACAGDTVYFSNGGLNYNGYSWDFGDGTTSNLPNAFHSYQDSGVFIVTLTVFDSTGCSKSFSLNNAVQIFEPQAMFTIQQITSYCSYVKIELDNQSTGHDYSIWDFDSATTFTTMPPTASYYYPGNYSLSLTVTKSICSSTYALPLPVVIPDLRPDFSFTQSDYCLPASQQFIDQSKDAISWSWDFGDGTTDTVQDPIHYYAVVPSSPITLTVKDIYGCAKVISKPNIQLTEALFTVSVSSGCNPLSVSFTDSSQNVNNWFWNFGDNQTSTQSSPVHVYNQPGYYDVQLIVESTFGCYDTLTVDSMIKTGTIEAQFSFDNSSGCTQTLVQFTDQTLNAASWFWDFGDGYFSNQQHPSHVFNSPGIYHVMLVASDSSGCSDTLLSPYAISIYGTVSDFTLASSSGCGSLQLDITNHSQGATFYEWNFGNGIIDTTSQPSYTYLDTGSYIVTLITSDSSGCISVYSHPDTIHVYPSTLADFALIDTVGCTPYTLVVLQQSSLGDNVTWYFGDGNTGHDYDPGYIYTVPGSYVVSLVVTNQYGCIDSLTSPVPLTINEAPVASFVVSDSIGCSPLMVTFTNTSSSVNSPTYFWDFGNGDTSSLTNVSYTYSSAGSFNVSLTVVNAGGCADNYVIPGDIQVYDQSPPSPVELYCASVVNASVIDVKWRLKNLIDLDYYVLYRLNNSTANYDSIGYYKQTNGSSVTIPLLTDSNAHADLQAHSYKVLAVDFCKSHVPLTQLREHTTIFLQGTNAGSAIQLNWSGYNGTSVGGYRIYRAEGASTNFQWIGNVDSLTFSFTDTTSYCPHIYSYKVEAFDLGGESSMTSFSNVAVVDHRSFSWQQLVEVTRATVVNNNFVLIEWNPPLSMQQTITGFDIFRSIDNTNYTLLATVGGTQYYYEDKSTAINHQNYFYKISTRNFCDVVNDASAEGSSILLQGTDANGRSRLRWTPYHNWDTGVDYYILEKLTDAGTWEHVKTTDGKTTEAED